MFNPRQDAKGSTKHFTLNTVNYREKKSLVDYVFAENVHLEFYSQSARYHHI